MRLLLSLLTELSGRLGARVRRVLLMVAMAGLVLFAGTTVTALHDGNLPDVVAGAVMLLVFAALAAAASTGPNTPDHRHPT